MHLQYSAYMLKIATLSTRLRPEVKARLLEICERAGLKVTAVVEQALREKLEDLDDALELDEAVHNPEEMIPYRKARRALKRDGAL
jgi:predicted DNA-binding protein